MSIFAFYTISMSILHFIISFLRHFRQFLSRLTFDSTTFKVAVSHFIFYPCGQVFSLLPEMHLHNIILDQKAVLLDQKLCKQLCTLLLLLLLLFLLCFLTITTLYFVLEVCNKSWKIYMLGLTVILNYGSIYREKK